MNQTAAEWMTDNLDELRRRLWSYFRNLTPDDRQDAVSECISDAWRFVRNVERAGGPIALTAAKMAALKIAWFRSGRRFTSANRAGCRPDVYKRGCVTAPPVGGFDCPIPDDEGPFDQTRRHIDLGLIESRLNERQTEVFRLLAGGLRPYEIAAELGLSTSAVAYARAGIATVCRSFGYRPSPRRRPNLPAPAPVVTEFVAPQREAA